MDDGLLSALGAGFQGMGAVASPAVAQRQAQERANALPNMIRGLQIRSAQRAYEADQAFSKAMEGMQPSSFKTSSDVLNALNNVPMDVIAASPQAQNTLKLASGMQQREALAEQRKQTLELQRQRIELEQARLDVATGKAPPTRNRIAGDQEIQEEYDPTNHSWREIGRGPRFKPATQPGSEPTKGWTFYKDKEGNLLRFNPNAGLVEKKTSAGSWEQTDELPEGLTKLGNLAGGGALNQRYSGRVIGAANEGYAALNSIAKLSDPSSGIFSAKAMGGAEGKNILAGAFTPERIKRYNATIAGLANEIATAQNQGMVPNEEQIKAVREAISIGPTDDAVTARYRVALAARYLRKGLEVSMDLANPDQKKRAGDLLNKLEAIPDPDEIETNNKGPGMFPQNGPSKAVPGSSKVMRFDAQGNLIQ